MGIAGILALTWLWPGLRSLRGFLWAVLAFDIGTITKFAFATLPPVSAWLQSLPSYQFLLVDALLWVAFPGVLMALTLIGSKIGLRELFLTRGDMRARGRMLIPFFPAIPWPWLILVTTALFIGPFLALLISLVHPNVLLTPRLLGALPIILAFGLINSAQEEFRVRVVFLARLAPILGGREVLLMSSLLFGLAHWVGNNHPNGPLGALITGLAGWILGASILETRGVAWAWIVHALAETIVITTLVMTTVR